ncbi:MAG: CrtK protein [Proteobacteria bacterium SG_bin5]|nr:tryptophan-rich sensory protein [Sphingomonas sp.]OQW42267.1 MAG: CrtK protein [Proteobacteria bacterium SG_bin5]
MREVASKGQLWQGFARVALVTVPLVLLLGFAAARLVPTGSDNPWYRALVKPAITPPDWAFPVAWTTLYALMGLALALIVHARGAKGRGLAIALFAAQLAVNLAWSPIFFGAHLVFWALVTIALMFALALAATIVFARIRALAALLMLPYLAWIGFAGLLTYQIDRLNPHAEALVAPGASAQIGL